MAWVIVPGSNDVWEYDNAGTSSYSDAPGTVTAGIRTFTMPNGNVHKLYVRCRKAGEDLTGLAAEDRGELSKDFYDARVV
jgi:hypothetical protein